MPRQIEMFDYTFPEGAIHAEHKVIVKAYRSVAPGLIVTPYEPCMVDEEGHSVTPAANAKDWVITHEGTGAKLIPSGVALTRRVALLACGALGGLYDWTTIKSKEMNALADVSKVLREANMYHWLRSTLS
jgi:hypothetical protein